MKSIVLAFIRGYQRFISPALPPSCIYEPTCSHYGYEAIEKHGIINGVLMTTWRVLRCNPFSHGGYDPVPENWSLLRPFSHGRTDGEILER